MRTQSEFYILCEPSNIFGMNAFSEKALPVVWNQDGEYRVIPKNVIQNAIDNVIMHERANFGKTKIPKTVILWDQGIPISNLAGRALIGE